MKMKLKSKVFLMFATILFMSTSFNGCAMKGPCLQCSKPQQGEEFNKALETYKNLNLKVVELYQQKKNI